MSIQTINIIGAGSIGHLWAGYLSRLPLSVKLYTRHYRGTKNIRLCSTKNEFDFNIEYQTLSHWQAADLIIICVKSTQLDSLCQQLNGVSLNNATIILMMNGLGIIEIASQYFPQQCILQASITHGAYLQRNKHDQPSVISHTGFGETLIGDWNKNISLSDISDELVNIVDILNSALPATRWNNNQRQSLYLKVIVNAIINPLTALYDVNNGAIVSNETIQQKSKQLIEELSPLIKQLLPSLNPLKILEKVETIANQTYTNISSMRQDILGKRKTEIDFINGYLLKVADSMNIDLPKHKEIVRQIKSLENEY